MLTVDAAGLTVMGHPMQIQGHHHSVVTWQCDTFTVHCVVGQQYLRHNFFFNVGFLFSDASDSSVLQTVSTTTHDSAPSQAHAPLVAKLARYFRSLEIESGFLSNDDTKQQVAEILYYSSTSFGFLDIQKSTL